MHKPSGELANNIDPLILLNIWAHHLANKHSEKCPMIFAGLGKPSYPLNQDIAQAAADYWNKYAGADSAAIDYGLPAGEHESRALMAQALSTWYSQPINAEDIVFSVGALAALTMIFRILNTKNPDGYIITPAPYYPFYNNPEHNHNLHLINVMDFPGYKLTAQALQEAIASADNTINAFLFCDPNNPLGSVIGADEFKKIAEVLKATSPDIPIILDEAYSEMVFSKDQYVSLFTVAPELKERIIILRSATKAFSASGERMAVAVCFNKELREELVTQTVFSYVHFPKSLQYAYAYAMANFTPEKRIELSQFYQAQVQHAHKRLVAMNAQMPDSAYSIEGTFYILADLSVLLNDVLRTDEDICYSLMHHDQVMVAPLSYFGIDATKGFVRITCSAGIAGINELMDRIENRLTIAKQL